MDSPNSNWHPIFTSESVTDRAERNFSQYEESLMEYVGLRYSDGVSELETPESVALGIGSHARTMHGEHIEPIIDDLDSTGERVIVSYIGALAMERSD